MKEDWIKLIPQIVGDLDNIVQVKCPCCEKQGIEYVYIGDEETRVGYLQIWCSECLKGIYVSRVVAPDKARFVTFEDDLECIVPNYELVEE